MRKKVFELMVCAQMAKFGYQDGNSNKTKISIDKDERAALTNQKTYLVEFRGLM